MLSRHFLRCKVLQELYATQQDERDKTLALRNFEYHVGRLNELGIVQLALMTKLLPVADQVLEELRHKFRPTQAEKQPNKKLMQNIFLNRMADNYELKKHIEKWAGCWDTNEDLLRETFIDLRQTKLYGDYLSFPENTYQSDKDFAIELFRYLMNRESLVAVIQERSLLWEDDFEQIAQYNFMMLKTLDEASFDEAMQWPLMYDNRIEKDEDDMNFARTLLRSSIDLRDESDDMLRARLQGWEFDRVAMIDILLVNMAIAEYTNCPTIPEKVTTDEYIELSKEFSTDRSKLFINAILDKIVLELRHQGRVQKSGRGLPVDEPTAE